MQPREIMTVEQRPKAPDEEITAPTPTEYQQESVGANPAIFRQTAWQANQVLAIPAPALKALHPAIPAGKTVAIVVTMCDAGNLLRGERPLISLQTAKPGIFLRNDALASLTVKRIETKIPGVKCLAGQRFQIDVPVHSAHRLQLFHQNVNEPEPPVTDA